MVYPAMVVPAGTDMRGWYRCPDGPWSESARPRSVTQLALNVVVERELVGARPNMDRQDLVLALEADPRVDQVGRENASLGEVFVVCLEAVDHRGQLGWRLRDVRGLFRRQLVEVLVDGRLRLDLVPDAVQARHQ